MQLELASVHSGEGRTKLRKKQSSISHISIYILVAEHGATGSQTSLIRKEKISMFLQIRV